MSDLEKGWSTGERDEFGHPTISLQPEQRGHPEEIAIEETPRKVSSTGIHIAALLSSKIRSLTNRKGEQ